MNEIYDRIDELCQKKSINITNMCHECKIPRAILTDFKMGRIKSLSTLTLSKISKYFNVSVDYLYYGTSENSNDDDLKIALFGGETVVTDEMWNEVKRYAKYVKERENENTKSL